MTKITQKSKENHEIDQQVNFENIFKINIQNQF